MNTDLAGWTEHEQSIAREAFDRAYARAIVTLIDKVKQRTELLESADMLWQLHDYLSIERHTMEGRFDFRLNGILFVFASLVKDGLLQMDELAGLAAEKRAKILAMSLF
jgi:hypothetical protein